MSFKNRLKYVIYQQFNNKLYCILSIVIILITAFFVSDAAFSFSVILKRYEEVQNSSSRDLDSIYKIRMDTQATHFPDDVKMKSLRMELDKLKKKGILQLYGGIYETGISLEDEASVIAINSDYSNIFIICDSYGNRIILPDKSWNEVYVGYDLKDQYPIGTIISIEGNDAIVKGILNKNSYLIDFNSTEYKRISLDKQILINTLFIEKIEGADTTFTNMAIESLYCVIDDAYFSDHIKCILNDTEVYINSISSLPELQRNVEIDNYRKSKPSIVFAIITFLVSCLAIGMINLVSIDKNQKNYWIMKNNGFLSKDIRAIVVLDIFFRMILVVFFGIIYTMYSTVKYDDKVDTFLYGGILLVSSIIISLSSLIVSNIILKYKNSRMNHGG